MNDGDFRDRLYLYNTMGRRREPFETRERGVVKMFTCGPSVYRTPHLGNYRTFLYEDILHRYLQYRGNQVRRLMNLTDVEDKALAEAQRRQTSLESVTAPIVEQFRREAAMLGINLPAQLPRSSTSVEMAAEVTDTLMDKGYAYRHGGNIYFDPLQYEGFGRLYGLDMSKWPRTKRRFSRDTYSGLRWNLGDFILWHGFRQGHTIFWDTMVGRGRPSWNVQDPAMILKHLEPSIDVVCGGIDNLYRHHDYTLAIMEAYSEQPFSRFFLHGGHLYVEGKKMSKSRGNVLYLAELLERGFSPTQVRFFLTTGMYRDKLNFTFDNLRKACATLDSIQESVSALAARELEGAGENRMWRKDIGRLGSNFVQAMNNDLDVPRAIESLGTDLTQMNALAADHGISPSAGAELRQALSSIDSVLGYELAPSKVAAEDAFD
jgi:cysteinyl-tRNA synthetase